MAIRYCPNCNDLVEAKVLKNEYSQIKYLNVVAKRRKIIHRIEDGGCGHEWYTLEFTEDSLQFVIPTRNNSTQ